LINYLTFDFSPQSKKELIAEGRKIKPSWPPGRHLNEKLELKTEIEKESLVGQHGMPLEIEG
jgi:hypothetical protein